MDEGVWLETLISEELSWRDSGSGDSPSGLHTPPTKTIVNLHVEGPI